MTKEEFALEVLQNLPYETVTILNEDTKTKTVVYMDDIIKEISRLRKEIG